MNAGGVGSAEGAALPAAPVDAVVGIAVYLKAVESLLAVGATAWSCRLGVAQASGRTSSAT